MINSIEIQAIKLAPWPLITRKIVIITSDIIPVPLLLLLERSSRPRHCLPFSLRCSAPPLSTRTCFPTWSIAVFILPLTCPRTLLPSRWVGRSWWRCCIPRPHKSTWVGSALLWGLKPWWPIRPTLWMLCCLHRIWGEDLAQLSVLLALRGWQIRFSRWCSQRPVLSFIGSARLLLRWWWCWELLKFYQLSALPLSMCTMKVHNFCISGCSWRKSDRCDHWNPHLSRTTQLKVSFPAPILLFQLPSWQVFQVRFVRLTSYSLLHSFYFLFQLPFQFI